MQRETRTAVGCDGMEKDMMTLNRTAAKADTNLMTIVFVALVGLTMLFTVGLAQSQTLHDAAHDVRHASGFPCH